MVSEDTSVIVPNICRNGCKTILSGIRKMSNELNQNEDNKPDEKPITSNNSHFEDSGLTSFVECLIEEICDNVFKEIQEKYLSQDTIVIRRNKNFKEPPPDIKSANRNTYILDNGLFMPSNSLLNQLYDGRRAISDCMIDENDNSDYSQMIEAINENIKLKNNYAEHESTESLTSVKKSDKKDKKSESKKKKKITFNSIFGKKDKKEKNKDAKSEEMSETYDKFEPESVPKFSGNSLRRSKKYASAIELNQQPTKLQRTPSFIKKLVHIGEDSKTFLKRSLSFRDVDRKRQKGKIMEMKKNEWKESLQSLVENDSSVSYNDLSFVDYDALNNINYEVRRWRSEERPVCRTRSMIEKRSCDFRPTTINRGTSISDPSQPGSCLAEQSGALSLPSLHHSSQEYAENSAEASPSPFRYRRRPQSISSEDGGSRSRPRGNGSFRSAGSGCAKLKRHNACRQKSRSEVASLSLQHQPRCNDQQAENWRKANALIVHSSLKVIYNHPRCLIIHKTRCGDFEIAAEHRKRKTLFNIVKIFSTKPSKIARESLTIDKKSDPAASAEGQIEWKKFVGSIRRKVQRHASSSGSEPPSAAQTTKESLSRKNSLTQGKFELFKSHKSTDEPKKSDTKQPLTKQKSIGLDNTTTPSSSTTTSSKHDYFKALGFKDKSKSVSVKHANSVASPAKAGDDTQKGVRKSDKLKDSDKSSKSSPNFSKLKSSVSKAKEEKQVNHDDFLKATMRIFLVVSPPVGKMQVRSRSLNHLDRIEMRQGVVSAVDPMLKDARSEPDCTRPHLVPPVLDGEHPAATTDVPYTRKHMLTRSQKSSSECFSVNFEVGDESTWDNELFFPAQRGISLYDSLAKQCELRTIDLSACDARLQDKETNTETFLALTQDTASLVGRHVRITAKDPSNKKLSSSTYGNHTRKQSGNYKPRTSSFFSSSTEESTIVGSSTLSLHEADQSKKQIKQRFTAFFGNTKDTKFEALIEQLDKYSKQGIPKNNLSYPQGQCESIDALYVLEDDWKDIVIHSDLTEKQQQQQTALWELIKTEVAYIKTLKVVTDLFLACLRDLQSKNLLKEIDTEKLFSNITEILDANVMFWRNTLFPLVRDMRKYKRPACIENMLEGFSAIHDIFQPYYKYCAEQSRCQHYCREKNVDSEVFTAYLTWCESQKDCNRLRLMDILVQPMQRMTKYGLLLKAILKNTDEDVERENLQTMIKMVDDFVINVNSSLKHKQDKERLKGIIARIESYDIVETKDDDIEKLVKKERCHTQLDLTRPMLNCPPERKRHLLLEGDLKLKDSGASKMEVHCFLLTDMLLICKPSTKKGGATMRVIRQPYLVDRLVISELHRETPSLAVIYKNEFDMAIAAFILQNNDAKKLKGWKDGIMKAQSLYAQAKQMSYVADESLDADYGLEYPLETDYHNIQLAPRSPLATSSRASRVSSLAHSHSGSVEMNDQSSVGSVKEPSRCVSVETENRTGSLSSDEGVQSLPPDNKSPVSQKNSFKNRLFHKTPNTLSVQPYGSLGQSLPNLTLGSPNVGSLSLSFNQNTLSVPNNKSGNHLLSPTHRGISYPPPSPTRGNLRRGLAISQSKNPPLIKTRHVNSTASASQQIPTSFDFDVPVIAGVSSQSEDQFELFSRGHHRQAVKRVYRNDKRYHTAGVVDDIKKNDNRDSSIHKRLSWNCSSQEQRPPNEDHT